MGHCHWLSKLSTRTVTRSPVCLHHSPSWHQPRMTRQCECGTLQRGNACARSSVTLGSRLWRCIRTATEWLLALGRRIMCGRQQLSSWLRRRISIIVMTWQCRMTASGSLSGRIDPFRCTTQAVSFSSRVAAGVCKLL